MTTLWGDLETYCDSPLKHGTYQYAEKCEIMLFAYGIDGGDVKVWDLTTGAPMPDDLAEALLFADVIVFQNSMFDRSVFRLATNSPPLMREAGNQIHRWFDTMVQALAHSLPGALEKLGDILKIDQDQKKQATGKALVRLFCIPPAKNLKRGRATRHTHPLEWAQFVEYAEHDIHAMRAINKAMPSWNYRVLDDMKTPGGRSMAMWHLDQKINDRGFCVDLELAEAAIKTVAVEQQRLKVKTQEMTGYNAETGEGVESARKRDKLLAYILEAYGIPLPDMKSDTLERRIQDPDLPIELRNLLSIRLLSGSASVSKYLALVRAVSSDGRLRGTMQFYGAFRTGRWAHRGFQPGNMPRPDMTNEDIEAGIEAIKAMIADLSEPEVMRLCVNAIRGCIIAPPGRKLVVADLANIEGRVAAWLGGELWKLLAFQAYDAGDGPDLYIVAYARAFSVLESSIDKKTVDGFFKRQIGKVMELMLQYEGGVGAFITGAATYGIDLDEMAAAALPTIPADVLEESTEFYEWTVKKKRSTFGLERGVFIACDALKRLWRLAHPGIVSLWKELLNTVTAAIERPGNTLQCRALKIRVDGVWLRIGLPSGRSLCYPNPQIDESGKISYMGVNQYTRKWQRIGTYGGKFFENVTQAIAYDVIAHGITKAEEAGYENILSVHDEALTETPDTDDYTVEGLCECLTDLPVWAEGLPLAAAGFEGPRYHKE